MLDTHALVFLAENRPATFGPAAREALRSSVLLFSPAVRLELAFLHQVRRISRSPAELLASLLAESRVKEASEPFGDVVTAAATQDWTRDPFDRLIAGHAALLGLPLVSRDRTMSGHVVTIW